MQRPTEELSWQSVEVEEGSATVVACHLSGDSSSDLDEARFRRACRQLCAENARLRSLLGHCPKGIAVLDEHGNLCGFNREFVELLGNRPNLGEPIAAHFSPTDRELLRTVVQRAGTTRKAAAVVRIEARDSSSPREIEFLVATLPSGGDRSIGVILAGEDRTAVVEDELARLTLDDANRRDAFALAAASMRRDADLLRRKALEALHRIASSELAVRDAIAALEAQEAILGASPDRKSVRAEGKCDVGVAARRAARLSWIGRSRRRISVDVQIDEPLAVRLAEGDLVQVLTNVLSNAVNAIEDTDRFGWVTISAEALDDRNVVEVSIRDNGRGLSPHLLQRALEGGDDGHGIGLAIARSIVESHGGSIRALSEPDRGTTIVVTLPLP